MSVLFRCIVPFLFCLLQRFPFMPWQNFAVQFLPCINQCKGLIYIQDYNVNDDNTTDNFCSRLQKEYNLHEVQKATWITPKNPNSTPLLLTFRENEPPRFLNIPGESAKTKVYEYFERPMNCRKCLEYSHTHKNCRKQMPTCTKCKLYSFWSREQKLSAVLSSLTL